MTQLLEIDQALVEAVTRRSGNVSAEAAVESALRKYLLLQQQEAVRGLRGSITFWPDYDHKKMRESRFPEDT